MRFSFDILKKITTFCMTVVCISCFVIFTSADGISVSELKSLKSMILDSKIYYNVEYDALDLCERKSQFLNQTSETETIVTTLETSVVSTAASEAETLTTTLKTALVSTDTAVTTVTSSDTEAVTTTTPVETTETVTTTTERQPKPNVDYLTFGIDVSVHQGSVNWQQVQADGVEYAILRAGYGKYISQIDSTFETNYARCKSLGIPVGAYWYSYATTVEGAEIEADAFIYALKGKTFEYPVYFDIEDPSQSSLPRQTLTDITKAFCQKLEDAGYYVGIYTNVYWTENLLYQSQLVDYDKWLAHWRVDEPKYGNSFGGMWQYGAYGNIKQVEDGQATVYGQINGITAACDVNVCYRDYPTLIKSKHFNGY